MLKKLQLHLLKDCRENEKRSWQKKRRRELLSKGQRHLLQPKELRMQRGLCWSSSKKIMRRRKGRGRNS